MVEIAEKNQKTADDLTTPVNDLQKISSSSEKQIEMVNQLVSRIKSTLGEAVKIRLRRRTRVEFFKLLREGYGFFKRHIWRWQ